MKSKGCSDYSQPDFYHFSEDSTKLASFVTDYLMKVEGKSSFSALDICAGCGVVGIEIMREINKHIRFDFCELQSAFIPLIKKNLEMFVNDDRSSSSNIIHSSFVNCVELSGHNKYDLIVCNPPYFSPGSGRHSVNNAKDNCRFFNHGNYTLLLDVISQLLTATGKAFVLARDDSTFQSSSKNLVINRVSECGGSALFMMFLNKDRFD